jgi:hypothetical protein
MPLSLFCVCLTPTSKRGKVNRKVDSVIPFLVLLAVFESLCVYIFSRRGQGNYEGDNVDSSSRLLPLKKTFDSQRQLRNFSFSFSADGTID